METRHIKKISRALISVYDKGSVRPLVEALHAFGIELISTSGTLDYIRDMGIPVTAVEDITGYASILGGRVKTLHPSVFGGILARSGNEGDQEDINTHDLQKIDMVVVDLYPFGATLDAGASHETIIEQFDIGGISLIRAAAKNYDDVFVVPGSAYFDEVTDLLQQHQASTSLADRRRMAAAAMNVSSHYDTLIFRYLDQGDVPVFKQSIQEAHPLRYGENPHQQGCYYGRLDAIFDQLAGKPLSYNNLLDIDAAMGLMTEFSAPTFIIIKHTNACGVATRDDILDAWKDALAGDPVSAFGGVLITNRLIDVKLAEAIHELFFEVLIAPGFDEESISLLTQKKNRILLRNKSFIMPDERYRSILNGVLWQTQDHKNSLPDQWRYVTSQKPDENLQQDLVFANTIVKHLKSNAIALVKNNMLLGTGTGQTSRVDALRHAIEKARNNKHDLNGAVIASDAFFPFNDCVEIAHREGIDAVIQPGGSVRDQQSIDYCDNAGMAMVFTGNRHFRH